MVRLLTKETEKKALTSETILKEIKIEIENKIAKVKFKQYSVCKLELEKGDNEASVREFLNENKSIIDEFITKMKKSKEKATKTRNEKTKLRKSIKEELIAARIKEEELKKLNK